ncbi:MAG: hypothetical protein OXI72_17635 [Gemmatimonadota bacterium]|nr:hypothetical protein [Gemmatimonadota bacterium]
MTYRSLLLVCLATLGLAVAGWGQADGKIAFTSWREGAGDVWIMNGDGSDPVNLTQGRHRHCVSPAWSPDGTKIAYLAFSKDPASVLDYSIGDVWVMDADGGNPQQMGSLTNPRSNDLIWAEDGSSIYFINYLIGSSEVFVVALDGSGSSLMDWREAAWIVKGSLDNRGLSPDGTKQADVVLQDSEGDAYLYLAIFAPGEVPQPSEQIEDLLNRIDFRVIPLPDLPYQQAELEPGWFISATPGPTWSPDSMKIAFSADNEQGDQEVWVVDIDGSNLVNLTDGLGGDYPAWQPVFLSATATSVESQSWGRIKARLLGGTR